MPAVNVGDFDGILTGAGSSPNFTATGKHNDGIVITPTTAIAAGATINVTITNANIGPLSIVQVEVLGGNTTLQAAATAASLGTINTTLGVYVNEVTCGVGSFVVNVKNGHASATLNGPVCVGYSIT